MRSVVRAADPASAPATCTPTSAARKIPRPLYLDSRLDLADLSAGNREILQTLALEASTVLENARLLEQERARQRLEDELRIARDLQQSLLPSHLPTTGWFRVVGSSVPTHHVGGDYLDAAPAAGGDWWTMVVADVSGKGIGSALMASLLQGAFLHAPIDEASIRAMLGRINTYLYERTAGEKYATVFYAALHKSGRLLWSNAAHCPPVMISADGTMESLPATSMAVGMLDFTTFAVREKQLSPERASSFSAMATRMPRNPQGDLRSVAHQQRVEGLGGIRSRAVARLAVGGARRFTAGAAQPDDMTLVVSEYQQNRSCPMSKPTLAAELMAEFLGTLVLMLFGTGVVAMVVLFGKGVPAEVVNGGYTNITLGWGLGVVMGILVAGKISGAHLNPAVTVTLAAFRGFPEQSVALQRGAGGGRIRRRGYRIRKLSPGVCAIRSGPGEDGGYLHHVPWLSGIADAGIH